MINRNHFGKDDIGYIKHLFHPLFIASTDLVNYKCLVWPG